MEKSASALEPIPPARRLSPAYSFPKHLPFASPFPPDDRSYGWERGTAVSKEWVQATTNAAIATAGYIDSRLDELTRSRENDSDRAAKLRAFCRAFAERAFRRPLTDEQAAQLIDHHFQAVGRSAGMAVKRVRPDGPEIFAVPLP